MTFANFDISFLQQLDQSGWFIWLVRGSHVVASWKLRYFCCNQRQLQLLCHDDCQFGSPNQFEHDNSNNLLIKFFSIFLYHFIFIWVYVPFVWFLRWNRICNLCHQTQRSLFSNCWYFLNSKSSHYRCHLVRMAVRKNKTYATKTK